MTVLCETKEAVRRAIAAFRDDGGRVGFVPTMGALHDGHIELVRQARLSCEHVVASIFVNPTQFGESEDFNSYPRTTDDDLAQLQNAGVDAVFLPQVSEIYPTDAQTFVDTEHLSGVLVGKIRPGHFRGVATVVTKLLNIVQPDYVFFGEKDYQQLQLIRQVTKDLHMPVSVTGVPTVRETDGLAMSSRNRRLTPDNREAATALNRALDAADLLATAGPVTSADLQKAVLVVLRGAVGAAIQSVDIVDAVTLEPLTGAILEPAAVLLAVRFGDVLLIDQRVVVPGEIS